MSANDLPVEILKDIRSELQGVHREQVRTNEHLDLTNQRLGLVESTLEELAEQHRFLGRHTKASAARDHSLDARVSTLESRVDKLETK